MAIVKKQNKSVKKNEFIERVRVLSEKYSSLLVFICDNVCSNQLKKIRKLVENKGELLMGKNSLFKKGILASAHRGKLEKLLPQLNYNICLLFTKESLKDMRDLVESVQEMAPVRPNMIAQCDVIIPKGLTSLPPDKTSFFQALNISTMINKANIQIMSDINLLKTGQKVGASEAALMKMLDMRPFSYKMITKFIYDDGLAYPSQILDIGQKDILDVFSGAVGDLACVSLAINYPIKISVPHMVKNALMECVSICLETDLVNEYVNQFKDQMKNVTVQVVQEVKKEAVEIKKQEKKEPEPEEEEEEGGLADLFGD